MRWLAAALVLPLALSGCTDFDGSGQHHLGIHGIDVQAKEVRAGSITLEVAPTLDNLYGRSGALNITVKAYDESTGMLVETETAAVGEIPKDRSHRVPIVLGLPRLDAFRFEVQVEEDGRIVQTGRVTASNLDALSSTVHDTGLRVGEVDVEVRGVEGDRADLRLTTYLTNEGSGPSRPLDLQMRVRDIDTRIVAAEAWTEVPPIAPDTTHRTVQDVSVPDGVNYVLQVAIWEDDIIVEEGQGKVQLLPTFTVDPAQQIRVTDPDISRFIRDDAADLRSRGEGDYGFGDSADTPGPPLALAGLAVLATAIILRRERA